MNDSEAARLMSEGINPFREVDNPRELLAAAIGSGIGIGINAEGMKLLVDFGQAEKTMQCAIERLNELLDSEF